MKKTVDYQKLRGFNYTQPDAANDRVFWAEYHHDIVDRDMGYAERLHLNSARIFLSYDFTNSVETWYFHKSNYFYGISVP